MPVLVVIECLFFAKWHPLATFLALFASIVIDAVYVQLILSEFGWSILLSPTENRHKPAEFLGLKHFRIECFDFRS